jgi:hypothetical protein
MLTATVSGSFHRHMGAITRAVNELVSLSVRVLSPADPRVVGRQGEFLFVASDPVQSVRLVQDRHLDCIRAASFLWLVCPDGYVGQSASMEIGFAAGADVPIYASHPPLDVTLREYVRIVPSIPAALTTAAALPDRRQREGLLINPHASIEEAHDTLERIKSTLSRSDVSVDPAFNVRKELAGLRSNLLLPTSYVN